MSGAYFRIGEMAQLSHVSTQTLRLYDKYKLLSPEYLDPDTGYRYYTLAQCAKLDLIRALKSCRLSLTQIRNIFSLCSDEELSAVLGEQEEILEQELFQLSVSKNNLARIRKNLQMINTLPPVGEAFLEYVPERKIDVQRTEYDFFSQGYSGYERMLRQMQNYLHAHNLPASYFINVGTLMEREDFIGQNYRACSAFIFVDDLYPKREDIRVLSPGLVMAIVSDDAGRELEYAEKLHAEIGRRGMTVCGDYLCEVLSQFPASNTDQLVYKIQIPVKKSE